MANERVERRLAAILAADVAGYSRLMGADEAGTRVRLNDQFDGVIRPAIASHRGRLVKTMGDGLLVEFASVLDAVQCAADIQAGIGQREHGEPEDRRMLFRIGIHLGDVIVEGEDIHGDGVNIAARLQTLAEPGGICVSDMVHAGVRNKLSLAFADLGEQSLKNIADPVRVFRSVLDAPGDTAAAPSDALFRRPAVAVLPFENLSGDPEQEYFADGLTEDIITALSLWRSFPVIARNSTFAYKGRSPDVREVGRELGARYVIEGSVRRSGNRVRVTAQLINAETGHHVWAERLDRDLADIFDLQDDITQRIAATVAPEMEFIEAKRSLAQAPQNLDAWAHVQRGWAFLNEYTTDGIRRARAEFERAIEIDPGYAPAHYNLARSFLRELVISAPSDTKSAIDQAIAAAQRAVGLDQGDPYAHLILGIACHWSAQHDAAIAAFRRALEINPSNAEAYVSIGHAYALKGEPDAGIPFLEKGLQLNPQDPRNHMYFTFMARAHLTAGRYETAADWAQRAVRWRQDAPLPRLMLAACLGHLGRTAEGRAELDACEHIRPGYTRPGLGWHRYRDAADEEHFRDGLRKVGWKG